MVTARLQECLQKLFYYFIIYVFLNNVSRMLTELTFDFPNRKITVYSSQIIVKALIDINSVG